MPEPKKPNNLKTGLIMGGIALFFFVMVFVKRIWLS
ncbi:MAG TPA: cytochrome oxidase small assembly protein [Telluria sp.]|nr:cytochrome oxidase small assembly protein [Telluria sp.]